ncbi:MAG: hypothetical protein K0S44_2664, partial [Bacteroidetes bacterium]|nr:hypothetical protein [Bacteroidota bacterium]
HNNFKPKLISLKKTLKYDTTAGA